MIITGAQFTKLLISKLERFLDSANAKPSQGTATASKALPQMPVISSEITSGTMSVEGAETPPRMDSSSMATSFESDNNVATLEAADDGAEKRLRDIIATYTGVSPAEIAHDANIDDLGVDSLAAVELAEELQNQFGKELAAEDLLESSFGALLEELGIDSLSAVELKGDLEDAFNIEIEDDRFTLDSTVKEILDFLGIGGLSQEAPSPPAVVKKPTNQAGGHGSSGFEKRTSAEKGQGQVVELASPFEALVQCDASFDQAAAKCGFQNYWTEVAPKQDVLLLAYICEAFEALGSDIGQIRQGRQVPPISHLPKHEKVMNRLLEILEKHDLLKRQGSQLIRGSRQTPLSSSHEKFLVQHPRYAGKARLMALTGPKLADCLTGKANPIALMFRGAAAQKVMEDYYCASPMLSTLTEQIVTFLRTVVTASSTRSSDTPIRIFEVGAGFGGTATQLAAVLGKRRARLLQVHRHLALTRERR
ncbi:MAG: hypothetical protein Q9163_000212 [Psora crenata]